MSSSLFHQTSLSKPNARLRGWQRITTKLKHNNRNHRGSMGLETPRVDVLLRRLLGDGLNLK
ncbi:hypothetical protein EYC50_17700, partial [Vibrio cholerae]